MLQFHMKSIRRKSVTAVNAHWGYPSARAMMKQQKIADIPSARDLLRRQAARRSAVQAPALGPAAATAGQPGQTTARTPRAALPAGTTGRSHHPAAGASREVPPPVEYAAAVDRYLARAALTPASRRVYLISLTSWAWPLVGREVPTGTGRRRAVPPIVPLALLDDPETAQRLAAALTHRATNTDARTVNRELSALRSAIAWWLGRGWIATDPTVGLRCVASPSQAVPPLSPGQVASLFRATTSLREHAFWRVLHDSGAPAEDILRLDVGSLDLPRHRARLPSRRTARPGSGAAAPREAHTWIYVREGTTQLLRWLIAGRPDGPVFLTDRRAPAGSDPAHVCPLTGRARMSYRRAVEIFTAATRPLDPASKAWTLQQLRRAALSHPHHHDPEDFFPYGAQKSSGS